MDRNEEARKKLINEEQIKKMKDANCEWPTCNKKNMMHVSLQLMKQTDKGLELENKPMPVSVPVPLCMYHFVIAQTGLCAVVRNPDNKDQFAFIAPVEAVQIAEAVVNAMAFTGKLKELVEMKDKADKKIKDMEKEVKKKNENQSKDEEPEGDKPTDQPGDKQQS